MIAPHMTSGCRLHCATDVYIFKAASLNRISNTFSPEYTSLPAATLMTINFCYMRFSRKTAQQQSPPLLFSAAVTVTVQDDFFQNPSLCVAENNAQNGFIMYSFRTPPSSPIPFGASPYKNTNPLSHDEEPTTDEGATEPSLSTVLSQPNSSPVTYLAAAHMSGGSDTWTGDDDKIKPVVSKDSTALRNEVTSYTQVDRILEVHKSRCVFIVESPVYV